jgi:hypothetical protein
MCTCYRIACVAVLLYSTILQGQSADGQRSSPDLITGLLKLSAPPPAAGIPGEELPQGDVYHSPVFSVPADDAPLDVLGRYWAHMSSSDDSKPNTNVSHRLLEFCESQPELLPSLLRLLPRDHEANERIKAIYDKNGAKLGDDGREQIRKHLELYSNYFHDELLSKAQAAKDDDEGGYVEHSDELERLAAVDWPRAETLLKKLAGSTAPRTALLAQTLVYRHNVTVGDGAAAASLRSQLRNVVRNRKALGYCRDKAAEALLETEWTGRDEWYLSLFRDPTLRELHDGMYLREPLAVPVDRDPDRWIPVMTRMVGDADRAVHDSAVSCLVRFHLDSGRKDALTPLLPWLMNPKWSSARDRLRLIQTVDRLDMKESIPGLIAVLGEEDDQYDRSYAAESLAYFRDSRAIPALRVALAREKEADHRRRIIKGLIACGGVSPAETARAIEAFAEFTLTPEGNQKWESSEYSYGKIDVPAEVALGAYIARNGPESDAAVELLVKRLEDLKPTQAALARQLRSLIAEWPSRAADRATVRQVRDGSVTAGALGAAFQRRESLQKTVDVELRELENVPGLASGFAAVLLADKQKELAILRSGNDVEPREALLAGARLVREKLPLEDVRKVEISGDALLSATVDAYLEAEDTPEARRLYLERHKGEARILGARQSFDPGHHSFSDFNNLEEQLRDDVRNAGEGNEVYALLSAGYWGNAGQVIVRAKLQDVEIVFVEDPARYYARRLAVDEWQDLQRFVHENHVDDLGPLNLAAWDGMQYEYVHLTRDGGRRVFMNNPGLGGSGGSAYDRLCKVFWDRLNAAHLDLHYRTAEKIAGFETIVADDRFFVGAPWKQGDDLRVAVYPNSRSRGKAFSGNGISAIDGNVDLPNEFTWVSLRDHHLAFTGQPAVFPQDDHEKVIPEKLEKERKERGENSQVWPLTVGGTSYRLADWNDRTGLWQFARGRSPRLVIEGNFLWPVITPDRKWALLAQCKDTWAEPNFAVRVDLNTGKSFRLDMPQADRIKPLSYVAERGAVLVVRFQESQHSNDRKPVGPKTPEFWLVDASTGKAEIVHGEFAPLEDLGPRPLQVATKEGRFWAAIYRETEKATDIGTYDPAEFAFSPVLSVPGLNFNSQQIWVDEAEHKAYISYKGQLLRLSMEQVH